MKMWIRFISYEESSGRLRSVYDRVAGRGGTIDNILQAHSLRPHTLSGHMALYKSVLHHTGCVQPVWFLETIGVFVSLLNGCEYCFDHHLAGLNRLVGADRAVEIDTALRTRSFADTFTPAEVSALRYTELLTTGPALVNEDFLIEMRRCGLTDGEILEINQVVAYFAYANRTVSGLGVTTEGDQLGSSPTATDDLNEWQHH
jgi:uncharacterized peroxidase-related enzyme